MLTAFWKMILGFCATGKVREKPERIRKVFTVTDMTVVTSRCKGKVVGLGMRNMGPACGGRKMNKYLCTVNESKLSNHFLKEPGSSRARWEKWSLEVRLS